VELQRVPDACAALCFDNGQEALQNSVGGGAQLYLTDLQSANPSRPAPCRAWLSGGPSDLQSTLSSCSYLLL
jgi:hypothetical protein